MTYCVGILLDGGLVMLADSRTNAGFDHIATFRKMTVWEVPGDRVIVLLVAGNLAVTQAVVDLLSEGAEGAPQDGVESLLTCHTLAAAARLVGKAVREVHARDAAALREQGTEFAASFILGGQIVGAPPRLFQIYAAGNYIEATPDTPYLQIGETKYGKPILDRLVAFGSGLDEAAKLALISMDSTLRSNISVGPPLDLLIYEKASLKVTRRRSIGPEDAYFETLRRSWSDAIAAAVKQVPDPN